MCQMIILLQNCIQNYQCCTIVVWVRGVSMRAYVILAELCQVSAVKTEVSTDACDTTGSDSTTDVAW